MSPTQGSTPDIEATFQRLQTPVQQSFCTLAWLHRFTNISGDIQLCCVAEDQADGHLRDDAGRPLFVRDGVGEAVIANSAHLRRIRTEMLAGRWPMACERCRVTEVAGSISRRQTENERFKDEIPWILERTDTRGFAPVRVRSRDYRLGNLCNLKCRMCHPGASVMLIEEWNLIRRRKLSKAQLEEFRHIDWYKQPGFQEEFRAQVHDLRHLHFAGGEPLIIPETAQMLEICIEEGCAKDIELTFNTNITKLPEKVTRLWPAFKGVILHCSVDGYDAVNDYIRYPARWKTIDQNLHTIDRRHAELNVTHALLSVTVQIYNIFHLAELVEYCHRFEFIEPMPHLIHLTQPEYFNVQILPPAMKVEAGRRLLAAERRLRAAGVSRGFEQIHGILNYMEGGHESIAWLSEFRRVTASLDRSRQEDLTRVVPELEPLMRLGPRTLLGQARIFSGAAWRALRRGNRERRLPVETQGGQPAGSA